MNANSPAPTGKFSVYPPFTEYVAGDVFRVIIMVLSLVGILTMLTLAYERWREQRRSATMFLVTLSFSLVSNGVAMIRGLGRPPAWWILVLFVMTALFAIIAVVTAVNELRRGLWRQ